MAEKFNVSGGAGPSETAAIAAVVAAIEDEERTAAAVVPKPIIQSDWIRTGRSTKHAAPVRLSEAGRRAAPSSREGSSD